MTSGLVLMDDVRWISFHSGYDFGYLLKVLTCSALPADENGYVVPPSLPPSLPPSILSARANKSVTL